MPSKFSFSSFPFSNIFSQPRHLSSRHLGVEAACARVKKLGLRNLLAQDVALDEVRQPDLCLVLEVHGCRDGEDLVNLLERELLCLAHETEDHEPRDEVESGVEPDCEIVSILRNIEECYATYKLQWTS
jgi:hypothetical protein